MNNKKILIWGAGKIGRGFIADIFNKSGYQLLFIDINRELTESLNNRGSYTILNYQGPDEMEEVTISNYEAYHISEKQAIAQNLLKCSIMALVIFPSAFEETAGEIAGIIERRAAMAGEDTLDILLCVNTLHPAKIMRELLEERLSDTGRGYLNKKVGLIETVIMRIAIQPTAEMLVKDPLVVLTNGYPQMPVDRTAFKGEIPKSDMIVYTKNIRAEEIRKMYTYNMIHVVFAYIGSQKGFKYVLDCINDEEVKAIALGTLDEISRGLQAEFGFTADEMTSWNKTVMKNMSNPILKDELKRLGTDPVRKLKMNDRLVGPALLCRKNGIMPYYLTKAIAGAFLFDNPEDMSCVQVKKYLSRNGIKAAIKEFCELEKEPDLVQLITEHYDRALGGNGITEDIAKINIIKKVYESGFKFEKTYKGCAQCTLVTFFDSLGKTEPLLFQAASGFSGGIAISGDGSCGGYTGGVMYMGTYAGRCLERILVDGDKEAQYKSYEMSQKLHDRFIETYGSVTCADIHKEIFGKSYCLRTKEVRDEFEAAGAHTVKCNAVIAAACTWIAEILIDEGFLPLFNQNCNSEGDSSRWKNKILKAML